jgi:hypothetical protein
MTNEKKLLLVGSVFFAGCVFDNIENGLKSLTGKDIRTAFTVLGYPNGKQQFGSDSVYIWATSRSGTIYTPGTATHSGMIGITAYSGVTSYGQNVPYHWTCQIRIITDSEDRIISWDYEGNAGSAGHIPVRSVSTMRARKFDEEFWPARALEDSEPLRKTTRSGHHCFAESYRTIEQFDPPNLVRI